MTARDKILAALEIAKKCNTARAALDYSKGNLHADKLRRLFDDTEFAQALLEGWLDMEAAIVALIEKGAVQATTKVCQALAALDAAEGKVRE